MKKVIKTAKKTRRNLSIDDNTYAVMQVEANEKDLSVSKLIELCFLDWFKNKKDRKLL
jgi:hypothetical protein